MTDWDVGLPKAWARALGMATVPLFGRSRAEKRPTSDSVLLDGEGSSFTLSFQDDEASDDNRLSWAWSSNVTYSFLADPSRQRVRIRRWDDPDYLEDLFVPDEVRARSVIELIRGVRPREDATVIARSINILRIVRTNIEAWGGNNTDLIRTFNGILMWVDAKVRGVLDIDLSESDLNLAEMLGTLSAKGLLLDYKSALSPSVSKFPVGDLINELEQRDPTTNYTLDPNLLIRHAAGALYQEAHKEMILSQSSGEGQVQRTLFDSISMHAGPAHKNSLKYIHFTQPWLARALVQESTREAIEIRGGSKRWEAFDPACGSAVFLIEFLREAAESGSEILLRGIDKSVVSYIVSSFCLWYTIKDEQDSEFEWEVACDDSLQNRSWGSPDFILMNPPFVSWSDMSLDERKLVRKTLGDRYIGRADLSFAFIAKAIDSLKPGAVMATLAPVSILDSRAAEGLRASVVRDRSLRVRLIGRFRGYEFFREATVEPVFLVVSRSVSPQTGKHLPTRYLVANSGSEDRAIRSLRRSDPSSEQAGGGWEISEIPSDQLTAESWFPRKERKQPPASFTGLPSDQTTISDLFRTHLGVRVGNKKLLLLSASDYHELAPTAFEREYFRPTADVIHAGRIIPREYIFYPYGQDGSLALRDEDALRRAVPTYYSARLSANALKLGDRDLGKKPWWTLARQRPTWMATARPKIVSKAFGKSGDFAYDQTGEYAVVQGVAWIWRGRQFVDTQLPYAYIALLNSPLFESLLESYCPQVRGGQFELYKKNVGRIPLPDLSRRVGREQEIVDNLATLGRSIHQGIKINASTLDKLASEAYGLSPHLSLPDPSEAQAKENRTVFKKLAYRWKDETAHLSNVETIINHPDYRRIIFMGESMIPLILSDLRRGHHDWFPALSLLSGENPIAEKVAGDVAEMKKAWLAWGKAKGLIR